jgi:PhnB protein
MLQWNPYLAFDGQCEAAFQFYARCLGGEIVALVPYSEAPPEMPMPPGHGSRIMHARLIAQGQVLMGADCFPGQPHEGMKGCSVAVQVGTPDEAERLFTALAEGGTVTMPLEATFWAVRFGMLTDRFGVPWMINCEKERSGGAS